MTKKSLKITWEGPFGWPGYESISNLKELPNTCGVYLLTFVYKKGYLIYCPGETNSYISRFKEHTWRYTTGQYHVLDIDSVINGKRKLKWEGWGTHKNERKDFEANKKNIINVCKELAGVRIFITKIGNKRIRQRLEAAIIEYLEKQPASIIDHGMFRSSRKDTEKIIVVKNNCKSAIHDLPEYLEI